MKINRAMVELLSSYSIAITCAKSKLHLIELGIGCMREIQQLYHHCEISLEQADSMTDYFSSLIKEEEVSIENHD